MPLHPCGLPHQTVRKHVAQLNHNLSPPEQEEAEYNLHRTLKPITTAAQIDNQRRARQQPKRQHHQVLKRNDFPDDRLPTHPHLAEQFRNDKWKTMDQLKAMMIQGGIVEHRISPLDALQRAIDDVTMDYLALRDFIQTSKHVTEDDEPLAAEHTHPLAHRADYLRECMVRYSTFASQYKIAERANKMNEARTALLAFALKEVLSRLGVPQDQITQAPKMLIQVLAEKHNHDPNSEYTDGRDGLERGRSTRLDPAKAEAIAEILHNDSEVVIEPLMSPEPIEGTATQVKSE